MSEQNKPEQPAPEMIGTVRIPAAPIARLADNQDAMNFLHMAESGTVIRCTWEFDHYGEGSPCLLGAAEVCRRLHQLDTRLMQYEITSAALRMGAEGLNYAGDGLRPADAPVPKAPGRNVVPQIKNLMHTIFRASCGGIRTCHACPVCNGTVVGSDCATCADREIVKLLGSRGVRPQSVQAVVKHLREARAEVARAEETLRQWAEGYSPFPAALTLDQLAALRQAVQYLETDRDHLIRLGHEDLQEDELLVRFKAADGPDEWEEKELSKVPSAQQAADLQRIMADAWGWEFRPLTGIAAGRGRTPSKIFWEAGR